MLATAFLIITLINRNSMEMHKDHTQAMVYMETDIVIDKLLNFDKQSPIFITKA